MRRRAPPAILLSRPPSIAGLQDGRLRLGDPRRLRVLPQPRRAGQHRRATQPDGERHQGASVVKSSISRPSPLPLPQAPRLPSPARACRQSVRPHTAVSAPRVHRRSRAAENTSQTNARSLLRRARDAKAHRRSHRARFCLARARRLVCVLCGRVVWSGLVGREVMYTPGTGAKTDASGVLELVTVSIYPRIDPSVLVPGASPMRLVDTHFHPCSFNQVRCKVGNCCSVETPTV